jgi:hypothetical protein
VEACHSQGWRIADIVEPRRRQAVRLGGVQEQRTHTLGLAANRLHVGPATRSRTCQPLGVSNEIHSLHCNAACQVASLDSGRTVDASQDSFTHPAKSDVVQVNITECVGGGVLQQSRA